MKKQVFSSINDKKFHFSWHESFFLEKVLQILINTSVCVKYLGDRSWAIRQSDSCNFEQYISIYNQDLKKVKVSLRWWVEWKQKRLRLFPLSLLVSFSENFCGMLIKCLSVVSMLTEWGMIRVTDLGEVTGIFEMNT